MEDIDHEYFTRLKETRSDTALAYTWETGTNNSQSIGGGSATVDAREGGQNYMFFCDSHFGHGRFFVTV